MDMTRLVAVGLISVVLLLTLKRHSPEFAALVSIAVCVLLFLWLLPWIADTMGVLKALGSKVHAGDQSIAIILKVIGVAYICEFGAQLCTDAGETAIASKIDLGGKVLIFITAVPVVMELMDLVTGILPG